MQLLRSPSLLALLALVGTASTAAAQCEPRVAAAGIDEHDRFGFSVAVADGWAARAAPGDGQAGHEAGAVHVHELTAGAWIHRQKLLAPDGQTKDQYGNGVAAQGTTLVVGAPAHGGAAYRAGAVYVLERQGGTYATTQKLLASDASSSDEFGFTLALDGDRLLVGARFADSPAAVDAGAVYVFERSSGVWQEVAKLTAHDGAATDYFGQSLDLDGDVAVVGAWGHDSKGTGAGAAYVFREATGWTQEQKLVPADAESIDYFGFDVAVDGDRIAVGAPGWDGNKTDQGAIYVFRHAGSWQQDQYLQGAHEGGAFGHAVALDGDWLLATAVFGKGMAPQAGDAAYLVDQGQSFAFAGRLLAPDGAQGDGFGEAVALDGDRVLVGAAGRDEDGSNAGAAYGFELPFEDQDKDGRPDGCGGVQAFCSCDAGPCGNDSPGRGCASSTGSGGVLSWSSGSLGVAADDLVLRAEGLPTHQFGLLFMGGEERTPTPLGDGLRCVAGPFYRFDVQGTGAGGAFDVGPGLVDHTHREFPLGGHVFAGQTWLFQAWYRDPNGPCGQTSNATQGLSVTFEG